MSTNELRIKKKKSRKKSTGADAAETSLPSASCEYEIPKFTSPRKKHKYLDFHDLTAEEESTLAEWVLAYSKMGLPITKLHVINSALLLLKLTDREIFNPRRDQCEWWYEDFLKDHVGIRERIMENLTDARAFSTEVGIKNWFANVKNELKKKHLLDISPPRVFSSETIFLPNVQSDRGYENLCVQITGNAAGQLTYPMIVYSLEMVSSKVFNKIPFDWISELSKNGILTAENFYEYITENFFPWLVENNIKLPVVLYLSNYVSYLTFSLSDFCAKHKILLVAFYPNSSGHPLETTLLSLQKAWKKAYHEHLQKAVSGTVLDEELAPLLESILRILDTETLKNGFAKCGLHPLSEESNTKYEDQVESIETNELKQTVEDNTKLNNRAFLKMFEEKMDPNTLQAFKSVQESPIWLGCKEDTNLFYFWKNAVDSCNTNCDSSNFITDFTDSSGMNDSVYIQIDELEDELVDDELLEKFGSIVNKL